MKNCGSLPALIPLAGKEMQVPAGPAPATDDDAAPEGTLRGALVLGRGPVLGHAALSGRSARRPGNRIQTDPTSVRRAGRAPVSARPCALRRPQTRNPRPACHAEGRGFESHHPPLSPLLPKPRGVGGDGRFIATYCDRQDGVAVRLVRRRAGHNANNASHSACPTESGPVGADAASRVESSRSLGLGQRASRNCIRFPRPRRRGGGSAQRGSLNFDAHPP
jgi:hypothetical protein